MASVLGIVIFFFGKYASCLATWTLRETMRDYIHDAGCHVPRPPEQELHGFVTLVVVN